MNLVFEGRVTERARARNPYLELPFEVPRSARRIALSYRHDPGSVLDLGLFEPSLGPFPSRGGCRGWSGGARGHVFVAQADATPGYLPGPLTAGTYRVVLGLAAVAGAGCAYRVEIDIDADGASGRARSVGPAQAREAADAGAAAPSGTLPLTGLAAPAGGRSGPGWYRGDLHSHSHHSDARGTLDDLRRAALERELDYLAVTEHNTISHHARLARMPATELLWVPGMEVTSYRGHANVFGVPGWVDFRARGDADVGALVRQVHERGGLFSVNHPKRAPGCIGCDWEYRIPDGIDCLEAWQGPWPHRNWESLARYDRLLRTGRRATLVGGSDRHQPGWPDDDPPILRVGSPTTWLRLAERSIDGLLAALRGGHASVSEGPEGPFLELFVEGAPMGTLLPAAQSWRARARVTGAKGETLRWVGAAGSLREVPIDATEFEDAWRVEPAGPFLRTEVVARASLEERRAAVAGLAASRGLPPGLQPEAVFEHPYRLALSNPVYRGR